MATTYYHGIIKDVDKNGNIRVLYPKTYASDVIMANGNNVETEISELNSDLADIGIVIDSGYKTVAFTGEAGYLGIAKITNLPIGVYVVSAFSDISTSLDEYLTVSLSGTNVNGSINFVCRMNGHNGGGISLSTIIRVNNSSNEVGLNIQNKPTSVGNARGRLQLVRIK